MRKIRSIQIPTKNISELVVEELEAWIRTGKVTPGDKLPSVRELCELLGVGRSAVRDAITTLKGKGLVEVRQGEGAFVCHRETKAILSNLLLLSNNNVRELYAVRKILEIGAVEQASLNRTERHLKQMEQSLRKMKEANPGEEWQADYEFHLAIATATQNNVLVQLMEAIASLMEKTLQGVHQLIADSPDIKGSIAAQHTAIFLAVKAASPEQAKESMMTHLTYIERLLLSSLGEEA